MPRLRVGLRGVVGLLLEQPEQLPRPPPPSSSSSRRRRIELSDLASRLVALRRVVVEAVGGEGTRERRGERRR